MFYGLDFNAEIDAVIREELRYEREFERRILQKQIEHSDPLDPEYGRWHDVPTEELTKGL